MQDTNHIPYPYIPRPHTRPCNNLILRFKIIENSKLKDHIINVDEKEKEVESKKKEKQSAFHKKDFKGKGNQV